jgi:hypothetical protein
MQLIFIECQPSGKKRAREKKEKGALLPCVNTTHSPLIEPFALPFIHFSRSPPALNFSQKAYEMQNINRGKTRELIFSSLFLQFS